LHEGFEFQGQSGEKSSANIFRTSPEGLMRIFVPDKILFKTTRTIYISL